MVPAGSRRLWVRLGALPHTGPTMSAHPAPPTAASVGRSRATVVARVLLVACLGLLAVAVLAPTSGGPDALLVALAEALARLGLSGVALRFGLLEILANVVILVPVGFLGALSFPRLRWQDWAAYAFLGALAVELAQGLLLPAREMSATDVVANTLGALLGAVAASPFRLPRGPGRV